MASKDLAAALSPEDGWFYSPDADLIQVVVKEPDGTWTVGDPQSSALAREVSA